MIEKYDSDQNVVATKTYCQDYEVVFSKIKCDFQNNKGIDTVYILVKKIDEPEALIQIRTI